VKQINVNRWAASELTSVMNKSGWISLVKISDSEHFVKGPRRIIVRYMFVGADGISGDTPVHSMKFGAVVCDARGGFHILGRRFSRLLALLQTRVADATEAVERVENSLKVTDDVFLARVYGAATEIFRGPTWRRGIERKVAIIRDAYAMLNAEAQARRAEVMELIVISLIAIEIVLALRMR